MADPLKVKAGDMLKIPVEVTYADNARGAPVRVVGGLMPTLVDGGEEFWLSRQLVEAAEHIPAPRAWRPRDAVRLRSGAFNDGIVVDIRSADKESLVYWPSGRLDWEKNGDLEPDEAPE